MTLSLTRAAASEAASELGWSLVLGSLLASMRVASASDGAEAIGRVVRVCGDSAAHLKADLRHDRVELSLRSEAGVTSADVALADAITRELGRDAIAPATGTARPVQALEIAIDALEIPAVLPFWQAVLAYDKGSEEDLVDPAGQGPSVWFQQMDAPREQRNRLHLDLAVAHDEAQARVDAALAAGGVLVSSEHARAFWVLADVEGNEVCICTWQDRD